METEKKKTHRERSGEYKGFFPVPRTGKKMLKLW
jgi:hypothetical protein